MYELVDFVEVIRIKMFILYAKVSFDRFGKELRFIGVCLGDFVIVAQCWIVTLTLWLDKVLDIDFGSVSKQKELQNFSQLTCISTLVSSLICFCNV